MTYIPKVKKPLLHGHFKEKVMLPKRNLYWVSLLEDFLIRFDKNGGCAIFLGSHGRA